MTQPETKPIAYLLARQQDLLRELLDISRELTLRQRAQDEGVCHIHGETLYGQPGMCESCNPEAFEPPTNEEGRTLTGSQEAFEQLAKQMTFTRSEVIEGIETFAAGQGIDLNPPEPEPADCGG